MSNKLTGELHNAGEKLMDLHAPYCTGAFPDHSIEKVSYFSKVGHKTIMTEIITTFILSSSKIQIQLSAIYLTNP